ncbi:MAG: RluA family pseudouridine synthase [Deltaproteobacteria bacterium]
MNKIQTISVEEENIGQRLDVFLSQAFSETTRSQWQNSADNGRIQINGKAVKSSRKLRLGELITIEIIPPVACAINAESIDLSVVYEDEHIIVVDKPAGMVTHPGCGRYSGTLVNAILYHCHDLSGIGGVMRPGIVHRLDKDTSGLLVIAKSDVAHQALSKQFKNRLVEKKYLTLVLGNVKQDSGEIALPIGRHPKERKLMFAGDSPHAKEALTLWNVLERFSSTSLLEVNIKTGRTHQIRVHMSAIKHPVVGDVSYGKNKLFNTITNTHIRAKLSSCKRQMLHSAYLSFAHPISQKQMEFSAPLPDDMVDMIDFVRKQQCAKFSQNSFYIDDSSIP